MSPLNLPNSWLQKRHSPDNAAIDALHISIACVHRMNFILTWNFKHIANASIRSKLEVLAKSKELKLPVISTPEELLF